MAPIRTFRSAEQATLQMLLQSHMEGIFGTTFQGLLPLRDLLFSSQTALASGITISLTDNGGNTAISSFSYSGPTGAAEVQDNYWYVHNGFGASDTLAGPVVLVIQGLDTSGQTSYDFTFISQGDQTGQGSSITIGGMTKESLGTQPNTSGFVDGVNYLQFDNLTPDSGGNILVSLEEPTTGDQRFAVLKRPSNSKRPLLPYLSHRQLSFLVLLYLDW